MSCSVSPRRRNTLDGHVVIGVVLGFTQTQYQVQSSFLLNFVVQLCTCGQTVFSDRQFHLWPNCCTLFHRENRAFEVLSLHSDVPHIVDSELCSHSACRSEFSFLVVNWTVIRLTASTSQCHWLCQHCVCCPCCCPSYCSGLSILAFWHCHFRGLTIPATVFAFALTVSPTVPLALACVSSFACTFACQLLSCLSFG